MMGWWIQWMLRLTHMPTGITVETDSRAVRKETLHKARERLDKRLRSRLWAEQNLEGPGLQTTHNYDLDRHGAGQYPNDLEPIKQRLATPPGCG